MLTKTYVTLVLLFCIVLDQFHCKSSSECDILGVHPDECDRYNSAKDPYFYCGGSQDKKIPMKYVNDDYCDCVHSGDDEPGTSACNNGQFWCINIGYRGRFIYSSLVNDGLCDCCDGSDETENKHIQCPNVCNEKARDELQEFIQQKKKYMEGIKVKNSLLQIAKSKLNEKIHKKEQILKDLEMKRAELNEKEQLKNIAEEKEKSYKEDKKQRQEQEKAQKEAERIAKCEAEGRENCETETQNENENENENETNENESNDNENEVHETPRERRRRERRERYEERAARNRERREKRHVDRANEAKQRLDEIKEKYEGDRPQIVDTDDDHTHQHTPDEEFPYPEQYRPHEDEHQHEHEHDSEHQHTPDEEFPYPEQYRPHDEDNNQHNVHDDDIHDDDDGFDWSEFDEEEDEDMYDEPPPPIQEDNQETDPIEDELSNKARDTRNAYNDVNREIRTLEDDLKDIEKVLEMDFGEKNIYASLFDECYSTKISKYEYEFCPFKTAQQKEGHSSTDLGSFTSFGYNEKKELKMSFEDGQKCWNGPKRSAHILFKCDTENEIVEVQEPSTCTYAMTFHTPLACQQQELDKFTELINRQFKTEL